MNGPRLAGAGGGRSEPLDAVVEILAGCTTLLRPGGFVVLTARPWRRHGLLVDFPGAIVDAAEKAGLVPLQRLVALLAGLSGDRIVPRASFFQLAWVRRAAHQGRPLQVIAHDDVLVFRAPT